MVSSRGKILMIPVFIGIVIAFIAIITFGTVERQEAVEQITFSLTNVQMKNIDRDMPDLMKVAVDFTLQNDSRNTLTLLGIGYELYANEAFVGRGFLSQEDIPIVGRTAAFPGSSITVPTEMNFVRTPEMQELWDKLRNNDLDDVMWRAEGAAQIETPFDLIDINFTLTL